MLLTGCKARLVSGVARRAPNEIVVGLDAIGIRLYGYQPERFFAVSTTAAAIYPRISFVAIRFCVMPPYPAKRVPDAEGVDYIAGEAPGTYPGPRSTFPGSAPVIFP